MDFGKMKQTMEPTIKQYVSTIFNTLDKKIDVTEIKIDFQEKPHNPPKFEQGKMYIYSFWLDNEEAPLKIGKAGPRSTARYTSHHYNANSSSSCLAKRIIEDNNFKSKHNIDTSISVDDLKQWIKNNCYRINIEMPYNQNGYDLYTLELVEAIMHNIYPPVFEGTTMQQSGYTQTEAN